MAGILERKHVIVRGELIPYLLRRSERAKYISITVEIDGRVIVTLPQRTSERHAERYVKKQHKWVLKSIDGLKKYRNHVMLPGGRADYLKNKERARALASECLSRFCPNYGLVYNRVAIKNLRRTWGSCSGKRNLNFNYKIVHLPRQLAEYVIVHELCHLAELNHSKRFWALVSKTVPDYKGCRKELRRYCA